MREKARMRVPQTQPLSFLFLSPFYGARKVGEERVDCRRVMACVRNDGSRNELQASNFQPSVVTGETPVLLITEN